MQQQKQGKQQNPPSQPAPLRPRVAEPNQEQPSQLAQQQKLQQEAQRNQEQLVQQLESQRNAQDREMQKLSAQLEMERTQRLYAEQKAAQAASHAASLVSEQMLKLESQALETQSAQQAAPTPKLMRQDFAPISPKMQTAPSESLDPLAFSFASVGTQGNLRAQGNSPSYSPSPRSTVVDDMDLPPTFAPVETSTPTQRSAKSAQREAKLREVQQYLDAQNALQNGGGASPDQEPPLMAAGLTHEALVESQFEAMASPFEELTADELLEMDFDAMEAALQEEYPEDFGSARHTMENPDVAEYGMLGPFDA